MRKRAELTNETFSAGGGEDEDEGANEERKRAKSEGTEEGGAAV